VRAIGTGGIEVAGQQLGGVAAKVLVGHPVGEEGVRHLEGEALQLVDLEVGHGVVNDQLVGAGNEGLDPKTGVAVRYEMSANTVNME
jgi:hypothetical protein